MRVLIFKRKRVLAILFFFVVLISMTCIKELIRNIPVYATFQTYFEPDKPKQGSLEEIYYDMFMALLDDYIDKAVSNYYIEHTGYSPNVDPWANKMIYIKRPNGYRTFLFEIKLEVQPYLGAHNSIGVDQITMTVSTAGVNIIGYKHIKDFPIPEHLR